ncbi:MAG: response regulator [Geobacteraceae bacterium]|nr:response regulator [Geobacteraceae bacterium]
MYSKKDVPYNAVTLSFENRDLEAAFREDYCNRRLPHLRLDLLAGISLYILFGIHDYWIIPDIKEFAWLIRYVFVCPLVFAIFLFTYSRHIRKLMQVSQSIAAFSAGAGVALMIVKAAPPGNYMSYSGLLLCILFYFRLRFISASLLTLTTFVLYETIAIWDAKIPTNVLFSNTFILAAFSLTGMYMCYTMEQSMRSGFLLRRTVEERNDQIEESNSELEKEILVRKQAETALTEQMEFLHTLLDTIPNPIFYTNGNGYYSGCNKAYETFFGKKKEDVTGQPVHDLYLADLVGISDQMGDISLGNHAILRHEALLEHADGTKRNVIFSKAAYADIEGNPAGLVGVVLDITDLRQSEEEKQRLGTQLFQAQKMEAVGQLAGGIAHEFNNILTAILGYSHLLKKNMREDDPLCFYVSSIVQSSDRAARLTRDLLAFSRKQKIEPKLLDLNELLAKTKPLLSMMIGEEVELTVSLCAEPARVMADSGLLSQALVNLALNARDAMPEGGMFSMSTDLTRKDTEFAHAHGSAEPGIYGVIHVSDWGTGMDTKTRERIFEPFFTTKEVGKGTGLGLSMVYGIIDQHKGCIDVHSELGKGTTFSIYLPVITEAEIQQKNEGCHSQNLETGYCDSYTDKRSCQPPLAQLYPAGTEMVLVAEDDHSVRTLTKNLLQENGYTIIEAVNGEDAINRFMDHAGEIQLLLLDVIMPKKNGWEAYETIRRVRPDIRVIFMSGYTADVFQQRAIPDEGMNVLTKPIPPDDLLRGIRYELDR